MFSVQIFTKTPISDCRLLTEWVPCDKGTTLGADNGNGVAAALAVLESTNLAHGPIGGAFSPIEEETKV